MNTTPKASTEGKQEEKREAGDKTSPIFSELTQPPPPPPPPPPAHRPQFTEPIKSGFTSSVRPAFPPGRSVIPIVPSSNVIPSSCTSSSVTISGISSAANNFQPVITKATSRPVNTESVPLQAVTTIGHHSLSSASALSVSAPMASIIRGASHIQTAAAPPATHLTHPAVQATYSSHVPRGAAAVACITALKPAVATPITRAPHIFAPGIVSTTASVHSSVQKFASTGMHLSPALQPRVAASMSTLRASIPSIPKTVPSSLAPLTSSENARSIPVSSSVANASNPSAATRLLIAGPRTTDTVVRPTLIHSAQALPKPHSFVPHIQQPPEKGFYKPASTATTVLSVHTTPTLTTISSPLVSTQQSNQSSHHSPQLQNVPSSVHLMPHPTPVGSVISPLTSSGLTLTQSQLPKVITQAIHTVAPISPLQLGSGSTASTSTKPSIIAPTAVAVTQSVSRPIVSTGNPPTAAIPVAKICPTPHNIATKSSVDSIQLHPEITRNSAPATLFVSSTQRSSTVVTTAVTTTVTISTSVVTSMTAAPLSSGVILTEARPERSAVTASSAPYFATGTTYIYESLPGVPNALAMNAISGAPTSHSLTTLQASTLRAVPAHQSALHVAAPRPIGANPPPVNVNPVMVTMNASRHPLVVSSPFNSNVENTSLNMDHTVTTAAVMSFSHSGTISYSSSPGQPATTSANPSSSPRPSILRKRTLDGASVGVRKNLLASLPSSQPPSPRSEPVCSGGASLTIQSGTVLSKSSKEGPHENGQSSESTDSSCNGLHPLNVVIKQEPPDTADSCSPCTLAITTVTNSQSPLRVPSLPIEASPRKKPRKQQLTGNELIETHSTEGEDDFEKESKDTVKKDIVKDALVALDDEGVRWVSSRQRPPVTLLNSYRHTWKSRHNHFLRHSDVKPRDERRPTVCELANQKGVVQKANGWKVYYICAQIDDLVDLEGVVHSRLSELLNGMEKKTGTKEDEDVDLSRANELMRGNIQRCKLIRDQMNDARQQVLKVLDHKSRIVEIVSKYIVKQMGKKK